MRRREAGITALYIFGFLKNLQFFGAVAVPFYLHRIGLSYSRMFILEMAFSAAMIALEVPAGIVADRWGRRIPLCLGNFFLAFGFFMFWFYQSLLARYDVLVAWFGFVGSAFNLSAMVGVTNLTLLGRPCFRPATAYLAASRVAG